MNMNTTEKQNELWLYASARLIYDKLNSINYVNEQFKDKLIKIDKLMKYGVYEVNHCKQTKLLSYVDRGIDWNITKNFESYFAPDSSKYEQNINAIAFSLNEALEILPMINVQELNKKLKSQALKVTRFKPEDKQSKEYKNLLADYEDFKEYEDGAKQFIHIEMTNDLPYKVANWYLDGKPINLSFNTDETDEQNLFTFFDVYAIIEPKSDFLEVFVVDNTEVERVTNDSIIEAYSVHCLKELYGEDFLYLLESPKLNHDLTKFEIKRVQ